MSDDIKNQCPVCESDAPHRHPATGFEGDVQICVDAFHLQVTPQNREHIPKVVAEIARRASLSDESAAKATGRYDVTSMKHTLDTDSQVFFYEQDHYYLSNFSAFRLNWSDHWFDTSEHAYQWQKFHGDQQVQNAILATNSAHDAFKTAERYRDRRRTDWDNVKVDTMRCILCAKVEQHEYVARKLLQTGDRILIENSWRDDFWGWGPNRDGKNMLGVLWMQIRTQMLLLHG